MFNKISPEYLIRNADEFTIIDVRTPSEFADGHIPGAFNMPLFSDEERAIIGAIYKQKSPQLAIEKGLEITGPKMIYFLNSAQEFAKGKPICLYCWRGGKRSGSIGWLLDFSGLNVSVIEGGYKAYRQFQSRYFTEEVFQLIILGGKTGSAKTEILQALEKEGEQMVDLEKLANHKGSAFGWISEKPQPSNEQFTNELFSSFITKDLTQPIWLENESKGIGRVYIPDELWAKMRVSLLINLEIPFEKRIDHLVDIYVNDNPNDLIESFNKIKKRLGGQNIKDAIIAIEEGDLRKSAEIALKYYDKSYQYHLETNEWPAIIHHQPKTMEIGEIAKELISLKENLKLNGVQADSI